MNQALIDKFIRHPISNLKRYNRFGGYFAYNKMMKGSKLMANAAAQLPAVTSFAEGLPIYFLTGKNYLYQTLFCIQSLARVSNVEFHFLLIDDGTFDQLLIEQIQKQLPGATIITKEMIEDNVGRELPEHAYPNLHRKRREYAHIKKLTDVHTIQRNDWKLVLDSDMMFWREPAAITDWLKRPNRPIHMLDCKQSYGYSIALMEQLCGTSIPDLLNVGVIGLNSSQVNWETLDRWIAILEEREQGSYYLEQALTAMLIGNGATTVLNADDYKVNPVHLGERTETLHHYVDLSKKIYFTKAWKKVIG